MTARSARAPNADLCFLKLQLCLRPDSLHVSLLLFGDSYPHSVRRRGVRAAFLGLMAIIEALQYRKLIDSIGVNGCNEKVSTACMVHFSSSS